MSGHWPYIIAAYTICFVLFAADWFASVFELKNLKRDSIMRQRRDAGRPNQANASAQVAQSAVAQTRAVNEPSNNDKPVDIRNE